MFGSMLFAGVTLYYKPDTRCALISFERPLLTWYPFSIQQWAIEEAKARLDARGEKYKYEPSTSAV
jgi:hypothetical protein